MYINIHSHNSTSTNELLIQNLYKDFERSSLPGFYSTGIHPWYIDADGWKNELSLLKKYSKDTTVLAIGECGLDKVCKTDFNLQEQVFNAQILLANEINKPLIIHCVRAFDEVLQQLNICDNKVPVLFHGFNKSLTLAEKIIQHGHWVSFGKALLQPHIKKIFAALPLDKIFLETDDADITIQRIYAEAASIKKISEETLSQQLIKNIMTVFNKSVPK